MKTLTLSTLVLGMYQSPIVALLIAIALVFIADLLNQYIESKKITCLVTDFSTWDYRSLQSYAKSHGIKANSKRTVLIQSLREV